MGKLCKILFVMFLTMKSSMPFASSWSNEEKLLLASASVLHIMDWGQTRNIVKNPQTYHEINPFLGPHPTMGKVNLWFLTTGLTLVTMSHLLPEQRTSLLGTYTAIQLINVGRNFGIGLRVDF